LQQTLAPEAVARPIARSKRRKAGPDFTWALGLLAGTSIATEQQAQLQEFLTFSSDGWRSLHWSRTLAWVKSRPAASSEHLLLALPRSGNAGALSTRDIARIVARHAKAADLPEDRRSPHVLRHTFCTHLADAGANVAVIRELAGHADIRTTTVYTAVSPYRLEHAIGERALRRQGARRAATQT
jgi:hypothetical protein